MNTFNIKVDSKLYRNPDFLEITSSLCPDLREIANETTKKIVQFEDEAIKNALKKLGWLSPEEHAELLDKHEEELNDIYNKGLEIGGCYR
jgi:hypothetical protein